MVSVTLLDWADRAACQGFDAYVRAHGEGTPFHLTAWGQALQQGMGHGAPYLVARQGTTLCGVLPLSHVKTRLFGNSLISNGFAVYGGPLADEAVTHEALDQAAWALAEKCGVPVLEYRHQARQRPDWPAKTEGYATFKRPLAHEEEVNLKAIPRKQRAEVRKSLENNLSVEIGSDAAALAAHYQAYGESVRNLGTPVFPRRWFAALLHAYGTEADILTVRHNSLPVASVLSLYYGDQVLPYYGGGVAAARGLRANEHMYWMLMGHAVRRGCTSFDFGRSKYGSGAYAFKKNWGFEPQPLAYEFKLAQGCTMPDVNPNNPKYKALIAAWRRLPLALANRLGPPLARGLG